MSQTTTDTSTPEQTGQQPGDGTAVNPVDAPTVVDDPTSSEPTSGEPTSPSTSPADDGEVAELREEVADLKRQVQELTDRVTAPDEEPAGTSPSPGPETYPGEHLVGHVVRWDGHDDYGNPRTFYGVVLGAHEVQEGKVDVARLEGNLSRAFDPADMTVLGS